MIAVLKLAAELQTLTEPLSGHVAMGYDVNMMSAHITNVLFP